MATPQDYLIAYAAAQDWCRDHKVPLPPEALEQLSEAIIDAVDNARNKRQQEH
jgi:hypothetical protein